jgi:hypothetical protein
MFFIFLFKIFEKQFKNLKIKMHSTDSDVGKVLASYFDFFNNKELDSKDTKTLRDLFSNEREQRLFMNNDQHCVLEFLNYIVDGGKSIFEIFKFKVYFKVK